MIERPEIYKTVLLGEGAVGKTSLRKRYLGEGFKLSYRMTIGADFAVKKYNFNGDNIISQIWDLAGQMKFSKVREVYYKGSTGALLVFDITRPSTLEKIPKWIKELLKNNNNKILPMMLVGNKVDLRRSHKNSVTYKSGLKYAKMLSEWSGFKIPYVEVSALGDVGIEGLFKELLSASYSMLIKEQKEQKKNFNPKKLLKRRKRKKKS